MTRTCTVPMRRVIAEIPRDDFAPGNEIPQLAFVERLRVVHLLQFRREFYSGICRVRFRTASGRPDYMVGHSGMTKVVTLARMEDGSYLAYFEGKPTKGWARLTTLAGSNLVPRLELTPESWRIAVIGTSRQLRTFLSDLRRRGVHHHVLSVGSADLREDSPLDWLTARQREALVAAYRSGYFDTPRRAGSDRVAKILKLGKSATVEHLRKGQKRLLDGILRS